jgi:hypothetical protein
MLVAEQGEVGRMVGRIGVLRSLSSRQSKGGFRGARGAVLLSFDDEDDKLGEGD